MATVLLVTKDAALGEVAQENLRQGGHAVALAKRGMEALQALNAMVVDVLVLDTAIDDVPVKELCQRLREDPDGAAAGLSAGLRGGPWP